MVTWHWAASALDFPFELAGSVGTVASVDAVRCWLAESARNLEIVAKQKHLENLAGTDYRGAVEKGVEG